jgi:uncharacterized protein DUF6399/IclR-like helix-turn-helix domain-containing protein
MGLWTKSVLIFNAIREHGKQSVRRLAERTGLSKSSVHRHLQVVNRRDRYPESSLWETEAGRTWLIRLVVATLFVFGLKRGVGAETISECFGRLHLAVHVRCSPSALRRVMHTWEHIILDTAAVWEQEGVAHGEIRPVIGAVDEPFLQRMMLVFMDLARGYLLMEEVAVDRSYAPWYGFAKARLETFGTEVLYLVSDRAKALVQLANTGLGCLSIPDVFHLSHELAKGYALTICGRLRPAKQSLQQARQRLEVLQVSPPDSDQLQQAQASGEACETSVKHWQGVRSAWRQHLANRSRIMHPWRLVDATRQTSQEVECQLHAELQALETLLATNGVPVQKGTLDKVRKQLAGVSALVALWWQTVWQDLAPMAMPPRWPQGVAELLLPLMYWQAQLSRTRCPGQKVQSARVLQAVQEAFERHPGTGKLTPEVLAGWKSWAGEHARAFQRASSAVEGRNGSRSQMPHNHRGLPTRRSQVWTVVHNFACRAADGTTPAARFSRRAFPDLCESVLSQIDELPLPRQRHQALTVSD